MTVVYWAVAPALAALAAISIWTGLRQWHGMGRPLSHWLRNGPMDAESRAGYDRGSLIIGLVCGSFAVMAANGAASGLHPGRGTAGFWIDVVALAGVLVFTGTFMGIMYFNRPRFLVPPHLRGELGAIAGRRRRRREHSL
jgi:hypothetical protein